VQSTSLDYNRRLYQQQQQQQQQQWRLVDAVSAAAALKLHFAQPATTLSQ